MSSLSGQEEKEIPQGYSVLIHSISHWDVSTDVYIHI